MKQSKIVVSVILVAAVLIAAYAIGLMVKQARTPEPASPSQDQQVSEPNAAPESEPEMVRPKTRPGRKELTLEERTKIKQERLAKIAEANDLTPEEKAQQVAELRERLVSRIRRNPSSTVTEEEKKWIRQRWSEMSPRQREAFNRRLQKQVSEKLAAADPNAATPDSPAPDGAEEGTSDPNAAK